MRHRRRRPQQVIDQIVDRGLHRRPGTALQSELDACTGLAFPAHHLPDVRQFRRHPLVGRYDFIERVCDLALQTGLIARQPDREVADTHRLQGM